MLHARLACDVIQSEETELRRLEGWDGATAGDGRCSSPCAAARSCEQAGAAALATPRGEVEGRGGGSEAREALVTGYAEHRASLSEKKNYRRALKIDLKLPEASTALADVPRRKHFGEGDAGRQEWKAALKKSRKKTDTAEIEPGTSKHSLLQLNQLS